MCGEYRYGVRTATGYLRAFTRSRAQRTSKRIITGVEIAAGYLGEGGSLLTGLDYGGRVWEREAWERRVRGKSAEEESERATILVPETA